MNPLLQLLQCGQSCWLDNLTRAMIESGELKRRITEDGVRGVTSNPAIFHKAISGSNDYDRQIEELVRAGLQVHEIYEELVVSDVREACDLLLGVYEETEGKDGYVSLEVSPYLAHDPEATVEEARRLFQAVARPNLLIKVPGTAAAIPAVEQLLQEGVNVNVTLLFSLRSYEAVARAYLRALERRLAEGKSVQEVASVASFFLSRLDVLMDRLLAHRLRSGSARDPGSGPGRLLGKFAIASAKLAYRRFKEIFSGKSWDLLAARGAKVQRLLWASTSTKNPLYSDLYYVEPLVGPETINTMPDETIAAFADHGLAVPAAIEAGVEEAEEVFADLRRVGVEPDLVTEHLLNEGLEKFIEPFDRLLQSLAEKRLLLLAGKSGRQILDPGRAGAKVEAGLAALQGRQFCRRLAEGDPFLWTAAPEAAKKIGNRLGWLESIGKFQARVEEIRNFAAEVRRAGFRHVVLLGMGGSSLCGEVCRQTFGSEPGWPGLLVLDNTDPAALRQVESQVDLATTAFIVASKSGTTTETVCLYRYFYEQLAAGAGAAAGDHFVAITDPGSPLAAEAGSKGFRRCFENPPDIGGRYSALSYFGLVPMALMGMDISTLLERALEMQYGCGPLVPAGANPGVQLGAALGLLQRQGRDKITFVLSEPLRAFGCWVEQLLAESTGKQGTGLVPVEGEPLGPPGVYGPDRVFVHLATTTEEAEVEAGRLAALQEAGHPLVRLELGERINLGAEFFRWEIATATAGAVMGVNPFDEPNVAESKENTRNLLQQWQSQGDFGEEEPLLEEQGVAVHAEAEWSWLRRLDRSSLREFLRGFTALARRPDYLAFLAYFLPTPRRHRALEVLRAGLRDRLAVATTLGYGPRYLHSTGQLHKGGANRGVFLLLTAEAEEEIPIPGRAYGFATLQRAQALGDFRSLGSKSRRVVRLHLGSDIETGLELIRTSLV